MRNMLAVWREHGVDEAMRQAWERGVVLAGLSAGAMCWFEGGVTMSGGAGDDSTISGEALWWPPDKISGRYLAPYLSSQVGYAADVMPQDEHAIPIETVLDPMAPDTQSTFGELHDLPQR